MILSRYLSEGFQTMLGGCKGAPQMAFAAAGGGGVSVHFYGNFNGVTQDLVNSVMNKAITAARRAGAKF
jgi:hypothetical protein